MEVERRRAKPNASEALSRRTWSDERALYREVQLMPVARPKGRVCTGDGVGPKFQCLTQGDLSASDHASGW